MPSKLQSSMLTKRSLADLRFAGSFCKLHTQTVSKQDSAVHHQQERKLRNSADEVASGASGTGPVTAEKHRLRLTLLGVHTNVLHQLKLERCARVRKFAGGAAERGQLSPRAELTRCIADHSSSEMPRLQMS